MNDIVVDFDGTVVTHEYPDIGTDVPNAEKVLKELVARGHNLVLFTMRGTETSNGDTLSPAVKWFEDRGIPLYGVQTNPTQKSWTNSNKAYGQIIIDDAALGCPLRIPVRDRPYVDWYAVEQMLKARRVL